MTNHSETTGPFENSDIPGREPSPGPSAHDPQVTLRTPAELADALPYLLGYRPEDSMVLVALHDHEGRGRFGGRARLGIPENEEDWDAAAHQLAHGLVTGSERRGTRPERMVAYVCQEPGPGESGKDVKRRLDRLAHLLRTQCGDLDVPVVEALCISGGRYWSYCCPTKGCCPDEGSPMGLPGTSVLAAAATYAGIQVRGTLRELRARLQPWETGAALQQEIALDAAGMSLVPRMLDEATREDVAEETLDLAERVIRRFAAAAPVSGTHPADLRDDDLLGDDEAATLVLGLQDRTTRDRAASWMEGDEAGPALRLWRALARRCVGPYGEHAAAPLTLAGWVAWSTGDELEAREALAMALGADPDYLFARLLHQACNEGLDPESIRRCLRAERAERTSPESTGHSESAPGPTGTERAEPPVATPGATERTDQQAGGSGAEERADADCGTATRRRHRVRPADPGDAVRTARAATGRRRPAGSRPRSSAAEPARPGTRGRGATRTRAAGADDSTASGAQSGSGHLEAEGDG
ncbi:DUF4192 family protein [Streptomyces sp. NPDC052301]|uniref:DUF4192 domain-containing protein n=1 Tax=Streptomyces sp. NPDC052301 TaxID=3365687 RepID=UPI0037D1EE7D